MTRPCKVGVQLPEVERFVPWPEYLDLARRVESAGYDSIWVGDHLIYDLPDGSTRGPYEAWTTLAAIAAVTERVEIGPLVASTSFHAPAMLAKQAATVDAISRGRLIVGLGAGWNRREYDAFGFRYDRRVSRFEEALAIIVPLLREGRTTFHGTYYDVDDCVLDPRPVRQGGPPIMLGSTSPRMLGIGLPVVGLVERLVEHLRQLCRAVRGGEGRGRRGHAEGSARRGDGRGPGHPARWSRPADGWPTTRTSRTVTPDDLGDHVRGMADAGATHLQLVLDPITAESIEVVGEALADVER